jgi:hypothetical protein
MRKIILFLALTVSSSVVSAYNKENHDSITRCAIALLNKYLGTVFITEAEAQKIIKGSVSEDGAFIKFFVRPWNMHFYSPYKPREFWQRGESIDVRFERIAKRWFNRKNSNKYFYSIGEIVHHIQDCTNPAHVVPVYHDGCLKDRFDEQNVTAYLPSSISIDKSIGYNVPYLSSVLNRTAIKTLDSIHNKFEIRIETNGVTSPKWIDWSYFWQDNPSGWFGDYGFLGNNYLDEKIQKGEVTYLINKSTYEGYSSKQIEQAVIETANFIYFAKTQLQKTGMN